MSIKPIFDCLLCCDECIVMRKISHDTLAKYADFQFKPFIPQLYSLSQLHITPIMTETIAPIPKVKHWSYFQRNLPQHIEPHHDQERSLFRKEVLQHRPSFEEFPHDVYNPVFTSEEEDEEDDQSFSFSEEEIRNFNREYHKRQAKKIKKKQGKRKSMFQVYGKSIGKKK